MPIPKSFGHYLDEHRLPYEVVHHCRNFTAQETAAGTHTRAMDFAKTVVVWVDNRYCMAVVPATCRIDIEKFKEFLSAKTVKLANEEELSALCPNCEIGAMPPFGEMFDLPVYISSLLTFDHVITFNGGTHEDAIRMPYRDYDDVVKPRVFDFTRQIRN